MFKKFIFNLRKSILDHIVFWLVFVFFFVCDENDDGKTFSLNRIIYVNETNVVWCKKLVNVTLFTWQIAELKTPLQTKNIKRKIKATVLRLFLITIENSFNYYHFFDFWTTRQYTNSKWNLCRMIKSSHKINRRKKMLFGRSIRFG